MASINFWVLLSFLKIFLSAQCLGNDLFGDEVSPGTLSVRRSRQTAPDPADYFLESYYPGRNVQGTAALETDEDFESLPPTRNSAQEGGSQVREEESKKDYLQAVKEVFGSQDTQENRARNSEDQLYLQAKNPVHKIVPRKLKLHLPKTVHPLKLFQLRHALRTKTHLPRRHLLLSPAPASLRNSLDQPQAEHEEDSNEMLSQILGSRRSDENSLHGAVLTKVTIYNITKVLDPKCGKSFLLEKKDNVTTNVNYLDPRERFTNYSDVHSSSLNTIISEKDLDGISEDKNINDLYSDVVNTDNEKDGEETNGRTETPFSDENSVYYDPVKHKGEQPTTQTQKDGLTKMRAENGNSTLRQSEDMGNKQLGEEQKGKTDFVGGQFVERDSDDTKSIMLPDQAVVGKLPIDFVGGQFIDKETTQVISEDSKEDNRTVSHPEFVGGQFINDRHDNHKPIDQPKYENGQRGPNHFVEGQFIEPDSTDPVIEVSSKQSRQTIKTPEEGMFYTISILGEANPDSQVQSNDDSSLQNNANNGIQTSHGKNNTSPNLGAQTKPMKALPTYFIYESEAVESSSLNPKISGPLFYSYESSADDTFLGGKQTMVPEEETTMIPNIKGPTVDSTFQDEQEEDMLGSTNENGYSGIFRIDPDTGHFVTERAEHDPTSQNSDPKNIQEILLTTDESGELTSTDSPFINNMGEFTEVQPTILKSEIGDNSLDIESSNPVSIDEVELYAGTPPMPITISDKGDGNNVPTSPPTLKDGPSNLDIVVFDENDQNITELCLPLGNKHNLSLFDIISGDFFIEKEGKKIPLYLRENPLKNCTSGSKTCKLYLDLKDENSQEKELSVEHVNEESKLNFGKRHVSNDEFKIVNLNLKRFVRQTTEENNKESNKFQGKGRRFDERISHSKNKHTENPVFLHPSNYDNNQNRFRPIVPLNYEDSIADGYKPQNSPDLSESSEKNDPDISSKPLLYLIGLNKHRNRPTRTVNRNHYEEEEDKKEDDCACSNSDNILQSVLLSTPNYKHFLGKRLSIMKNIVQTASDWASE